MRILSGLEGQDHAWLCKRRFAKAVHLEPGRHAVAITNPDAEDHLRRSNRAVGFGCLFLSADGT